MLMEVCCKASETWTSQQGRQAPPAPLLTQVINSAGGVLDVQIIESSQSYRGMCT